MSSFVERNSFLTKYSKENSPTTERNHRKAINCNHEKTSQKTENIKNKIIEKEYLNKNKSWSPEDGNFFVFLGDERRAAALNKEVYRPSSTPNKQEKKIAYNILKPKLVYRGVIYESLQVAKAIFSYL